jgi:hypothetical protein|eukprot:COSAG02_NODE_95_length_37416_cov_60.512742_12_plen_62_part_00
MNKGCLCFIGYVAWDMVAVRTRTHYSIQHGESVICLGLIQRVIYFRCYSGSLRNGTSRGHV